MRATRLLLIRHGHTAGNLGGGTVVLGSTDLPLTVQGIRQARRIARGLGPWPFDAIYSSGLQRAAATAREIQVVQRVPLRWCPGLQEIHCGAADGLEVRVAENRFPAAWAINDREEHADFRWPGGESYADLRRRVLAASDRIAAEHRGGSVVVVTHAGVVNQLLGAIQGLCPARWRPFRPSHCTVTEVDWLEGTGRLVRFDVSL